MKTFPEAYSFCFVLPFFFVALRFSPVLCDTPVDCRYEDILGTWLFSLGPEKNTNTIQCANFKGPVKTQLKITLKYPDVAVDDFGNEGFWTLIYNQGFEVVIAERKYFAFSKYQNHTSYCDQTMPGWSHDVLGHNWACYLGKKHGEPVAPKRSIQHVDSSLRFKQFATNSEALVMAINRVQSSWKAVRYPQFDSLTHEQLVRMAGGKVPRLSRPKPAPITDKQRTMMSSLPSQFDWRYKDGANFVSPVRSQGDCGSCYAFASMALNEARVRIMTNNTQTPVFSTQDIVECSQYSQGCEGGFPYLVGGKYAEDYGIVEEKCNPYKGQDGKCTTNPRCTRHYSTSYKYIGGYYGSCNEAGMMEAIYERGPIAVSFEVYNDFSNYQSGIYHHVFNDTLLGFNPFEITNHVVLIVGWGYDKKTSQKYWTVKNSWGTDWGKLGGYFKIRRGNDECGIESIAMESTPIITFPSD